VDYEKPDSVTSQCVCKREDFQCDFCFEPDKNNDKLCILATDCSEDPYGQPANCATTWNKTRGYRLVPGDKCNLNGEGSEYGTYAPVVTKCGTHGDGDGNKGDGTGVKGLSGGAIFGILVAVFFLIVGALGVTGFVLYRVNPNFREFVKKNTPSPSSLFSLDRTYRGSGSHEYTSLNSTEPQSLLDDLEGDDTAGLDDDLEDEAPELDDKSISTFTNQKQTKADPLSGSPEEKDSFI